MSFRAAVIGAGIAGATCARHLAAAGWRVEVFEKSGGAGGRMSTRRAETPLGPVAFDHGAQYFTVREDDFAAQVRAWVRAGAAESWPARLTAIDARNLTRPFSAFAWTGLPGMSAVVELQLEGLPVLTGAEVAEIIGEPGLWRLALRDGRERGFYHVVIVALPGEQAAALLQSAAPLQASAAVRAKSAPCWALMAAFDAPMEAPFDGARIEDGAISWLARSSSKPGRAEPEAWVAHASPAWTRAHLETEPEAVKRMLIADLRARLPAPEPAWAGVHLWRFAQVERAVGSPFGWDAGLGIGSCGDWYLGPRVELAWRSGDALGRALARGEAEAAFHRPAPPPLDADARRS